MTIQIQRYFKNYQNGSKADKTSQQATWGLLLWRGDEQNFVYVHIWAAVPA